MARFLRPPLALALCGAALLGWSVGGVASVDRDLQRTPSQTRMVTDHPHHHPHREL